VKPEAGRFLADAGASGRGRAGDCKGNIQPVRREFLSGLEVMACCRGNDNIEEQAQFGLRGEIRRYGLPFLGDNPFLVDGIREETKTDAPARWLRPLAGETGEAPAVIALRLDHDGVALCGRTRLS